MITEDKTLVEQAITSIRVHDDKIEYTRLNGETIFVDIPVVVPNYDEANESKYAYVENRPTYDNETEENDAVTGSTTKYDDGSISMMTENGYKRIRSSKNENGKVIKFDKFKMGYFYAKKTIVYSNGNLFSARISGIKYRNPDIDSYGWKKLLHNNMFRIIQRSEDVQMLGVITALSDSGDSTLNVNDIFDLCIASNIIDNNEILEIKEFIENEEDGVFSTIPRPREDDMVFTFSDLNSFACTIEYSNILPIEYGGISVIGYDENNNILYENSIDVPEGSGAMNHIEKYRDSSLDGFTVVSDQTGLSTKVSSVLIQNSNVKTIKLTLSHSSYNDRATKITPVVSFSGLSVN